MSQDRGANLALFIDFDNVALGARDARQRFDIKLLLQRVLEKGKIVVKKAYADWHYHKEHMSALHEAAIELIEIPTPRISGKNSADIRLVVDAMDLCYSKDHIDTFVIVSGDSDFSPLVSKLRENDKRVLGIGVKNSSSHLLINNCDEFMFYDDIYREAMGQLGKTVTHVPTQKRDLFDFLVKTAQSLLQESRGVLYSSLIKDTMTRKQPDFNERSYGYSTFGDLLDEARKLGLLVVERDARAGGTWVVQALGKGIAPAIEEEPARAPAVAAGPGRPSRRRRRSGGRGRAEGAEGAEAPAENAAAGSAPAAPAGEAKPAVPTPAGPESAGPAASAEKTSAAVKAPAKNTGRKAPAKKSTAGKKAAKKTEAGKTEAGKGDAGKAGGGTAAKKTTARKTTTKKSSSRRAPARKTAPKRGDEGAGGN